MTRWRYILDSLYHFRRVHLAVALGVATATAVLTGALLVGDSVRGSLRTLTLERLGQVDHVLVAPRMFRAALAGDLQKKAGLEIQTAVPVILQQGTLQSGSGRDAARANQISVVGFGPNFQALGAGGPPSDMAGHSVALTNSVARELGVQVGDEVLLRISQAEEIPTDSPLGEKQETTVARRLQVAAVLPPQGLARFGLVPTQHLPRNAFVPLNVVQDMLGEPDRANAVLLASDQTGNGTPKSPLKATTLSDFGIHVDVLPPESELDDTPPAADAPNRWIQISSENLVLPDAIVRAARRAFQPEMLQPVVTYLANTLVAGDAKIPYSTITGVRSTAELGPILDDQGRPLLLADDQIVLNRWAADDLHVNVGDQLTVNYYQPESTHGQLIEHRPPPVFRIAAVVDLTTDDGQPTRAADPYLTPELDGVTDQQSIADWDLPFELVEKIRPIDEDYWDEYSTTPKAFVSFDTAQKLWSSRWGSVSLLRIPQSAGLSVRDVASRLEQAIDARELGFAVVPVKQQGLQASAGTTPFDGLFLGFSFFLIAAAVMLMVLLFQLGVEQRSAEVGILAAAGVARQKITWLFCLEGFLVAAIGALVGIIAGVGYAWLMIAGLTTLWVDAIATPFLKLHVSPRSLAIGWLAGIVVSGLAIRWSLRALCKRPTRALLAGAAGHRHQSQHSTAWMGRALGIVAALVVVALALAAAGTQLHGEAQAGTFFGCGAALLAAMLIYVHRWMNSRSSRRGTSAGLSLVGLAMRNAARHPGRSTLTIGLVASACFLIVAISAFRLDTTDAGTGGFSLVANSDQPIHHDLNTADGRWDLGFSERESQQLSGWQVSSLRVHAGQDASCLSLYRPTQPRVLGVPDSSLRDATFAWAARPIGEQYGDQPWQALEANLGTDDAGRPLVPAVLDMNTAVYSLRLYGGVGSQFTIHDGRQQPVTLQVVGLLKNSLLQGDVLIGEENFLTLFPDTGGYQYFLFRPTTAAGASAAVPQQNRAELIRILEATLSDYGLDVELSRRRLGEFLAVQNTYLSTFQSLGALGLLLGTVGLAVVQLRSVLERRGELALMRAGGFRPGRLAQMVLLENGLLLVGGLAIGTLAAVVALAPHWMPRDASIPWLALAMLLAVIAGVGLAATWLATRKTLTAPLVPALRGQ